MLKIFNNQQYKNKLRNGHLEAKEARDLNNNNWVFPKEVVAQPLISKLQTT
jgi:hypothetical protein